MSVKLLTEHNFEFLSLIGGCTDSSETTLVKMPHCWKSHVMAQLLSIITRVQTYLTCFLDSNIHIFITAQPLTRGYNKDIEFLVSIHKDMLCVCSMRHFHCIKTTTKVLMEENKTVFN